MDDREKWLARTFVELADTFVADFDVIEFMATVVERCVELLGPVEVGLALAPSAPILRVASSTERVRRLELIEVQTDEGPCRDCLHTGKQVLNERLAECEERWPRFTPMAHAAGFDIVHALPLRLRDQVIGAMNIFGSGLRELSAEEVHLSQALADAATIGILQERALKHSTAISDRLRGALDARVVTEQAAGMVAEKNQLGVVEAFALLRGHARSKHLRLSDVARSIIDRSLAPADLYLGPIPHLEVVGAPVPVSTPGDRFASRGVGRAEDAVS